MKQSDFDYHKRQKGNWRRTIWNVIREELGNPRNAVAVYLAGNGDLDKPVALNKGFHHLNLIAVEWDKAVLEKLRSKNVLCVVGEFCDAVAAISKNRKIDVVFGDFCCGLENSLAEKIAALTQLENLKGAVFAFNFMRGRDCSSNGIRGMVQGVLGAGQHPSLFDINLKHRGLILAQMVMILFRKQITIAAMQDVENSFIKLEAENNELWNRLMLNRGIFITSYKSGILTFDSVVFRNPYFFSKYQISELGARVTYPCVPVKTQRSAAAILAHRTMRLNEM